MGWSVVPQRILRALASASLRRRAHTVVVGGVTLVVAAAMTIAFLPLPYVDGYLAGRVIDQISAKFACPGSTGASPQVVLGGGRLVPQLLRRRLSEVEVSVADTTLGNVQHAALTAKLRGVRRSGAGARISDMDLSITIPFSAMPTPEGSPKPTLSRTEDGQLRVKVVPDPEQAKNVRTTVFLKLDLKGNTLSVTPERLSLFGGTVPGSKFARLAGAPRTQKLPSLPAGLKYTSVVPKADGLHVRLDGSVTTPLSTLPTSVAGRTVSYVAEDGMLGISTAVQLPVFAMPSVPLTIFVAPRLDGTNLTMEPRSVRIFGNDLGPDDPISQLVLSQITQSDLARRLPALPKGVAYRSVSIVPAGIKMVVGGESVRPFSELPLTGVGTRAVFGAQDGFLTLTSTGAFVSGPALPVVLLARPKIVGSSLDLSPRWIEILDTLFPAADVLRELKIQGTVHHLPILPAGLSYSGVDVLPGGLGLRVHGENVDMTRTSLGAMNCTTARGSAGGRPG